MSDLRARLIRLAYSRPELRGDLLPLVKEARVTEELLRVKLVNLGDFGGTNPIQDSWILEVSGPTFDYRDELKKLGLRWEPGRKTWTLHAALPKYGNPRLIAEYERVRKIQRAAYPKLQELAEEHNRAAEAANKSLRPQDPREREELLGRLDRMEPALGRAGLVLERKFPSRYDTWEPYVLIKGNTYPLVNLMKSYGFRWKPSEKAWSLPAAEFAVVGPKWMGEVARSFPAAPEKTQDAVFTAMSDADLKSWISRYVARPDPEGFYMDGERSDAQAYAYYFRYLRGLKPSEQAKQKQLYERRESRDDDYNDY